ncbi:glutaredoxin [Pseudomonas gregormendelii]|uniref:Glutaredoxin n=1 Tax=Pseudomonas gregormendelii TaxID=1628277 RepID=A0ABS3ANG3_9PSED|nr:glutaredoxin [Pseudomonas gregormendelii]
MVSGDFAKSGSLFQDFPKGISYTEIDVQSVDQKVEMINRSGRRTVPQIFIGDWHVGGFDDLAQLDREGGLAQALNPRLAG